MKKSFIAVILLLFFCSPLLAQNCLETAKTVAPVLSENARKIYETKFAEAKADFEKSPNADSIFGSGGGQLTWEITK